MILVMCGIRELIREHHTNYNLMVAVVMRAWFGILISTDMVRKFDRGRSPGAARGRELLTDTLQLAMPSSSTPSLHESSASETSMNAGTSGPNSALDSPNSVPQHRGITQILQSMSSSGNQLASDEVARLEQRTAGAEPKAATLVKVDATLGRAVGGSLPASLLETRQVLDEAARPTAPSQLDKEPTRAVLSTFVDEPLNRSSGRTGHLRDELDEVLHKRAEKDRRGDDSVLNAVVVGVSDPYGADPEFHLGDGTKLRLSAAPDDVQAHFRDYLGHYQHLEARQALLIDGMIVDYPAREELEREIVRDANHLNATGNMLTKLLQASNTKAMEEQKERVTADYARMVASSTLVQEEVLRQSFCDLLPDGTESRNSIVGFLGVLGLQTPDMLKDWWAQLDKKSTSLDGFLSYLKKNWPTQPCTTLPVGAVSSFRSFILHVTNDGSAPPPPSPERMPDNPTLKRKSNPTQGTASKPPSKAKRR